MLPSEKPPFARGSSRGSTIAGMPARIFWILAVPKLLAVPVWFLAGGLPALLLFFSPAPWFLWNLLSPSAQGLVTVARRFRTSNRELWLTIDDGPHPLTTPTVLDWLDRQQAKATFLVIGAKAAAHPELIRDILRRGHQIGNHTHTHRLGSFWALPPRALAREIDRCATILREQKSEPSLWMRAPAGIKSPFLEPLLHQRQLRLLGWSARSFDSCLPPSLSGWLLRRQLKPGAIILLHEHTLGSLNTMIPGLLSEARKRGYDFVIPDPSRVF